MTLDWHFMFSVLMLFSASATSTIPIAVLKKNMANYGSAENILGLNQSSSLRHSPEVSRLLRGIWPCHEETPKKASSSIDILAICLPIGLSIIFLGIFLYIYCRRKKRQQQVAREILQACATRDQNKVIFSHPSGLKEGLAQTIMMSSDDSELSISDDVTQNDERISSFLELCTPREVDLDGNSIPTVGEEFRISELSSSKWTQDRGSTMESNYSFSSSTYDHFITSEHGRNSDLIKIYFSESLSEVSYLEEESFTFDDKNISHQDAYRSETGQQVKFRRSSADEHTEWSL